MEIIIVGCGKVGQTLAQQLNEKDNNITIIDTNPDVVNSVAARLDIMGVVGNGAIHSIQQEAGIEKADLLIAATSSDELNMLCCLIAKKVGNCQTIARIRNPEYSLESPFLQEELELAMVINPEYVAAAEIARVLNFSSAIKIDTFAKGKVELLKFKLPEGSPLINTPVKDIITKMKCNVLVCTIERNDEAYIAKGDFVFKEKDVISIIASHKNAIHFFKKIKHKGNQIKDIMIVGGGEITHYLCSILEKTGQSITVIEKDSIKCEEMASLWPDITVIHGDAVEKEILLEEGIADTGAFVATTNLDEENILLSLFAKSVGCKKTITKINRIDFDEVVTKLELDSIIYPKNITADMIVRYVRAMKNSIGSNVETLYNLIKGKVETAEFIIKESSLVTGVPLCKLDLKRDVLIAAILREDNVIIPRGSDVIMPGDSVVIVSKFLGMQDITDILQTRAKKV